MSLTKYFPVEVVRAIREEVRAEVQRIARIHTVPATPVGVGDDDENEE